MGDDARLAEALGRLVAAGTITAEQADAVRFEYRSDGTAASTPPPDQPRPDHLRSVLAEVGGYIGAAFVVAAGVAILSEVWDRFTTVTRVLPLVGGAAILVVAAVLLGRDLSRPPAGPLHRVVSVLLLGSAGLLAGAAGVLTGEGLPDDVVPAVALAVCLAGYLWQRGFLLHLGLAIAAWTSIFTWVESASGPELDPLSGVATVALAALWAALTWERVLAERSLGLVAAGVIGFVGAQDLIVGEWEWVGWLALLGVTVTGLAGYAALRELPMLAVGGISLAVLVPELVIYRTDGALGASGALLISGLLIVAGSVWALRRPDAPAASSRL